MSDQFDVLMEQLVSANAFPLLKEIKRGIEKESLRVGLDGFLSAKPHPESLGSALTHPFITTDYSEALLELITPPSTDPEEPVRFLNQIHNYVYHQIGEEFLWNASMPCMMDKEEEIPIARFGTSNIGQMKYVYREGLGKRYGRLMQTIAGVHYNFSLPQSFWQQLQTIKGNSDPLQSFISDGYMGLVRNFLRYGWMLPYLFGASPAICKSFVKGKKHKLSELMPGTMFGEYATSLRMSDMGYSNNAQSRLNISYDSVEKYAAGLEHAIRTPEPLYEEIGLYENGQRIQLNTNLLQIENEYYSNIRPKRVAGSGERPAKALNERGVEYIEVRGLDINPFSKVGITNQQIHWLDCFLITCALMPSAEISCREDGEIKENLRRAVNYGRNPELSLWSLNREVPLAELGNCISAKMEQVARFMDSNWQTHAYSEAVEHCKTCFIQPQNTLSGRFMEVIQSSEGYYTKTRKMALDIKQHFLQNPLADKDNTFFRENARISLAAQRELEAEPQKSFDEFVEDYYK